MDRDLGSHKNRVPKCLRLMADSKGTPTPGSDEVVVIGVKRKRTDEPIPTLFIAPPSKRRHAGHPAPQPFRFVTSVSTNDFRTNRDDILSKLSKQSRVSLRGEAERIGLSGKDGSASANRMRDQSYRRLLMERLSQLSRLREVGRHRGLGMPDGTHVSLIEVVGKQEMTAPCPSDEQDPPQEDRCEDEETVRQRLEGLLGSAEGGQEAIDDDFDLYVMDRSSYGGGSSYDDPIESLMVDGDSTAAADRCALVELEDGGYSIFDYGELGETSDDDPEDEDGKEIDYPDEPMGEEDGVGSQDSWPDDDDVGVPRDNLSDDWSDEGEQKDRSYHFNVGDVMKQRLEQLRPSHEAIKMATTSPAPPPSPPAADGSEREMTDQEVFLLGARKYWASLQDPPRTSFYPGKRNTAPTADEPMDKLPPDLRGSGDEGKSSNDEISSGSGDDEPLTHPGFIRRRSEHEVWRDEAEVPQPTQAHVRRMVKQKMGSGGAAKGSADGKSGSFMERLRALQEAEDEWEKGKGRAGGRVVRFDKRQGAR